MTTRPPNANGHRRRELRARILATSTHCALCHHPLNPEAKWPADDCTVIDENIPRSRGGNALSRENTTAMHNACNRWKSTMTLAEAHALITQGADISEPMTKAKQRALTAPDLGQWEARANDWTT